MAQLEWDKAGDRNFESGLDKSVLYLPDGSAVPWNGLTSVIEKFDKDVKPVYFDGKKINDLVTLGDFAATMQAITYPVEFEDLEGVGELRPGVKIADQPPKVFALCYRTQLGNDVDGQGSGYKIHILWNVTAIPNDRTYATMAADPSLTEFEWDLYAVPEDIDGFRPTAHFFIDSRDVDPLLLSDIETQLYGTVGADAALLPMADLMAYMASWYRIRIIDNGDGTWTADDNAHSGFISYLDGGTASIFQITSANAVFLDADTYQISDTVDVSDVT